MALTDYVLQIISNRSKHNYRQKGLSAEINIQINKKALWNVMTL